MKDLIISTLCILFFLSSNTFASSSEEELGERPNFKNMLTTCKIDPNIDHRVFKAFHAHISLRSDKMNTAALNELTKGQYYRWRFVTWMNSYGHQTFETVTPELNCITDMFISDKCDEIRFRRALRVLYDFSSKINKEGTSQKQGQDEINQCTFVFDLDPDEDQKLIHSQYFQYLYSEVGKAKLSEDKKTTFYQTLEETLANTPKEYAAIPEATKWTILTRVYISNINMLFDYMDRWMKQVYKDLDKESVTEHLETIVDSME